MTISNSAANHQRRIDDFAGRMHAHQDKLQTEILGDAARDLGTTIVPKPAKSVSQVNTVIHQGATVRTPDGMTWNVINDAGNGAVQLGRQSASGLRTTTVSGSELLRNNQHLLSGNTISIPAGKSLPQGAYLVLGDPSKPAVPTTDGVPRTPTKIQLELVPPPPAAGAAKAAAKTAGKVPATPPAGAAKAGVKQLASGHADAAVHAKPITTDLDTLLTIKPALGTVSVQGPRDIFDGASLTALSSPRAVAIDATFANNPKKWLAGATVSGTPAKGDDVARKLMHDVINSQDWLKARHGVNVITPENPILVITNSHSDMLNASMMSEGGIMGVGPLEDNVGHFLNAHLHPARFSQTFMLKTENSIAGDIDKVVAHEVGHQVTDSAWGVSKLPTGYSKAAVKARLAVLESGTAREAFSDLIMAARTGKTDVAGRNLNALRNGRGDYQQFLATFAKDAKSLDVHDGTQLLTQPLASFAKTHGWGLAGELTISTVRNVGDQIYHGDIVAESLPVIADAFRNSAAMRFGHDSAEYRDLAKAFARVKL